MGDMKLHLEEITCDNWQEVIRLKVTPNQQRYVMNNLYALAECRFYPERIPLAIYDDSTIVGMAVCSYDERTCLGWVHRLVIAEGFENRGYSTNSMQWIIRRFRRIAGCTGIIAHYRPENTILADFYRTYGFRETGESTAENEAIISLLFSTRNGGSAAEASGGAGGSAEGLISPPAAPVDLDMEADVPPSGGWTRPMRV